MGDNPKIDLAPWGYAPGNRLITCTDCEREDPLDSLHFLHTHATRCARHALKAQQQEYLARHGAVLLDVPDPEYQEAINALESIAQDNFIRRAFIVSIILVPTLVGAVILLI